jgi:hypothetical protein
VEHPRYRLAVFRLISSWLYGSIGPFPLAIQEQAAGSVARGPQRNQRVVEIAVDVAGLVRAQMDPLRVCPLTRNFSRGMWSRQQSEGEMTAPTPFPLRGQAARMDAMRAALRPLDTGNMPIEELVCACENAAPDALFDEIAEAIRQIVAEHIAAEAEGLEAEVQLRHEGDGK